MSTWCLCTSLKVGEEGKRSFRDWELWEPADPDCSQPQGAGSKPWPCAGEMPLASSGATVAEGVRGTLKRPSTEIPFTVLHGAKPCSRFFSTWPVFVAIKVASEPLRIFNASDLTTDLNFCLYPSLQLSKQNLCCWWGGVLSQRGLSITVRKGGSEQQCSHLPPGFK